MALMGAVGMYECELPTWPYIVVDLKIQVVRYFIKIVVEKFLTIGMFVKGRWIRSRSVEEVL